MLLLDQLQLHFEKCSRPALSGRPVPQKRGDRAPRLQQDVDLELKAHELLRALGASRIAADIRVEWNSRLKTCAGRANYRTKVISLNPRLREVRAGLAGAEIERTFLHELAHFLAQFRAGRTRIAPHGDEWRNACCDLGIAGEARCHNLPFPTKVYAPRYLYRCRNCKQEFRRVRRIRRAIACLACCRAHNRGEFDGRFRLRLINQQKETKETESPKNISSFTLLSSV